MINKNTLDDFYKDTGKDVFTTKEIVEYDTGKPYVTDLTGQSNASAGRKLKQHEKEWGIKEVGKKSEGGTTTRVWHRENQQGDNEE